MYMYVNVMFDWKYRSHGVDSSLETYMTFVGKYEIKPPICEKFIEYYILRVG